MTRHLFKLVWNRKKTNALIVLEIFVSFVVIFAVAAAVIFFANNYRRPLGFRVQDILVVSVELPAGSPDETAVRWNSVLSEVRRFPGVRNAAGTMFEPYFAGRNTGAWNIGGKEIQFDRNSATDAYADVMGLKVVRGRWFERQDEGAARRPVVLDRDFAIALYGTDDVVGRAFDENANPPYRVIGVIEDYRAEGELSPRNNYAFERADPENETLRIVAHLNPGAHNPQLENAILRRLERTVPGGSFGARLLERERETALRFYTVPVFSGAVVAAFLTLMVALGLTGVMWQNVTQRTRELGLRRALGAQRNRVRRQILVEICLIATLGLAFGALVVVQVPLMGLFTFIEPEVVALAFAVAATLIYGLALACGLYPSWLASRIEPAQALHYE